MSKYTFSISLLIPLFITGCSLFTDSTKIDECGQPDQFGIVRCSDGSSYKTGSDGSSYKTDGSEVHNDPTLTDKFEGATPGNDGSGCSTDEFFITRCY